MSEARWNQADAPPSSCEVMNLTVTWWKDKLGFEPRQEITTWPALVEQLANMPPQPVKERSPLIKLAIFGGERNIKHDGTEGALRHDGNVLELTGAIGEHDGEQVSPAAAVELLEHHKIRALVVTTHSHTSDAPRWRVLAPLSKPFAGDPKDVDAEHRRYMEILNGALGGVLSPESGTLSQSYFVGGAPGGEYLALHTFGDPEEGLCLDQLDLDEIRRPLGKKKPADQVSTGSGSAEILARLPQDVRATIRGGVDRGKRSDAIWAVIKECIKALMADGSVADVLTDPANALSAKALEKGDPRGWILSQIAGARAEVEHEAREIQENRERAEHLLQNWKAKQQAQAAAEEEAARPLDVDLSDLMTSTLEAASYVVDPLIPRKFVTLFGGHGGGGKSTAALVFGAHAACGRSWAGMPVEQCRVLYWSLEDDGELLKFRLRRIVETYGLDPAKLAANMRLCDGSLLDAPLAAEHGGQGVRHLRLTPAFEALESAAEGCSLIVVDNASDAFDGDENSRRQVRRFVRALARIAQRQDAAVLLLAHIDKNAAKYGANGNTYSGSTQWHNSVRSRLALVTQDGRTDLVHEKLNVGPKHEPIPLAWNGPVVIPTSADIQKLAAEARAKTDADRVLEVIRIAIEAGDIVPAAMSGPATALHALQPYPELGAEFEGKEGRDRFKAAVVLLLREERLVKVKYRNADRKERERLELAQKPASQPAWVRQ